MEATTLKVSENSHLEVENQPQGKRNIIFKSDLGGDMLVLRRAPLLKASSLGVPCYFSGV